MVSICCITYNHEHFIKKALDGFLMQKTSFKYEILIHDDASTDNTATIIREYEKEYPDIVKPIYQTENQYSKGVKISNTYNYPRVQGKYIAICEGDDFWTDENKLQKQVDFLESHLDYSMCCHSAYHVDTEDNIIDIKGPFFEKGTLTANEVIVQEKGWIATASILFRIEVLSNTPEFFHEVSVGDYPLKLNCFSKGKVYFDDSIMSAYRISLSEKVIKDSYMYQMKKNSAKKINNYNSINNFLDKYDEYTEFKYHEFVLIEISRNNLLINIELGNIKEIKNNDYFKKQSFKYRVGILCKIKHPFLYKIIKRVFVLLRKIRNVR